MPESNSLLRQPSHIRTFLLVVAAVAAPLLLAVFFAARSSPQWTPPDHVTGQMLIPPEFDAGRRHFRPETLTLRAAAALQPAAAPVVGTLAWRIGVGLPDQNPLYYNWPIPRPGWYLNWATPLTGQAGGFLGIGRRSTVAPPPASLGMEFTPMVRMRSGRLHPTTEELRALAANSPGLTWLIGNEPDIIWQDNTTPEVYAIAYHRAYTAIKAGDPTAQVAIGGLSQITPLRLAYLDRVWMFYRQLYGGDMPVDVWNMHAFVLREERDGWGANIPPGFEIVHRGQLWEVADHDNLALVEEQVRAMRRWMAAHGQQEKPLWISEYGILMPADYGFPPARVADFMAASFDLFRTLRDPATGYAADEQRLVQRWNWYSARDSRFAAGNLFDDFGEPTVVGKALSDYMVANGP
jgi:hypothetical protein